MTRGLTRSRRVLSLCRISRVASVMAAARCSGGKSRLVGDLAAHYWWGADERDPVGVQVDGLGAAVDQDTDGVVDEQVGGDLLDDHLGGLRAQHTARAALVGLQLVERALLFPPLGIQCREFGGRCLPRIEQGSQEPYRRFIGPPGWVGQGVLDHPDCNRAPRVTPRWTQKRQVGPVW